MMVPRTFLGGGAHLSELQSFPGVCHQHVRIGGGKAGHPDIFEGHPNPEIGLRLGQVCHLSWRRLIGGRALSGTDHERHCDPVSPYALHEAFLGQDADENG